MIFKKKKKINNEIDNKIKKKRDVIFINRLNNIVKILNCIVKGYGMDFYIENNKIEILSLPRFKAYEITINNINLFSIEYSADIHVERKNILDKEIELWIMYETILMIEKEINNRKHDFIKNFNRDV